jgi:hypothetical protein
MHGGGGGHGGGLWRWLWHRHLQQLEFVIHFIIARKMLNVTIKIE